MFGFFRKKQEVQQKNKEISQEDFSGIESFIKHFKNETGIDFSNKRDIVRNKLIIFCKKREIYSFNDLLQKIKQEFSLKQELIDYLTVNETYFFREIAQIEEMIEKAKKLGFKIEILCAPSSSGDEPYSISIMLLEAGFSPKDFHIIGIDISESIITKAKNAIYNERNLYRADQKIKDKYFYKKEDKYFLKEAVKENVTFRCVNIFDETVANLRKFDFIFSRNMMIYFDQETKIKAKNILQKLLKRPGESIYFGHADIIN